MKPSGSEDPPGDASYRFPSASRSDGITQKTVRSLLGSGSSGAVREESSYYSGLPPAGGLEWEFVSAQELPRAPQDTYVFPHLREALIRLNPIIAEEPSRANDVIDFLHHLTELRQYDGLVSANEEFTAWLLGRRHLPSKGPQRTQAVRLVDFERYQNNRFILTTRFRYEENGETEFDLALLVNGIPLALGLILTPCGPLEDWREGAARIRSRIERSPSLFIPNLFNFTSDGEQWRCGTLSMHPDNWMTWGGGEEGGETEMEAAVRGLLRPTLLLDLLRHYTLYRSEQGRPKEKVIASYFQRRAVERVSERMLDGVGGGGAVFHADGTGRELLPAFALRKTASSDVENDPNVWIVREPQPNEEELFPNARRMANGLEARGWIGRPGAWLLSPAAMADAVKEPFSVQEMPVILAEESFLEVAVEALERLRDVCPDAQLFLFTGRPLEAEEGHALAPFVGEGYLDAYPPSGGIRDGVLLPLYVEEPESARSGLTGEDGENGEARATDGEREASVCEAIARHFKERIAPGGFKGVVILPDRSACERYREQLARHLPLEACEMLPPLQPDDPFHYENRLSWFFDPFDPLRLLLVTPDDLSRVAAPALQAVYLDAPLSEADLPRTISLPRRPFAGKFCGLAVDYRGDLSARCEERLPDEFMPAGVMPLHGLREELLALLQPIEEDSPGEKEAVREEPGDTDRHAFARQFIALMQRWETLSPDPALEPFRKTYTRLARMYRVFLPTSSEERFGWLPLGPKTEGLLKSKPD